ncbi:MAG: Holliday junction resolvase RuvX [Gammaproteobacteria bacterium]|nr:Holliday junction resolvase RuvX [Gammaproteobacteria bacterium]
MKNPPEIVLGFDYGTKRIGVAVGQTVTQTARPLTMINAVNGMPQWDDIKKIIAAWHPDAIVVGIPYNMDGSEQPLTQAAKQFAESLKEKYELPVHGIDERLSSVAAKDKVFTDGGYKALKKTQIDSVAAQLILQNWLDQFS